MSHKLAYENAPKDHLKTWAMLQRLVVYSSVAIAITLLALFFAFMY